MRDFVTYNHGRKTARMVTPHGEGSTVEYGDTRLADGLRKIDWSDMQHVAGEGPQLLEELAGIRAEGRKAG
jgi:hypothetical protein